MTEQSDEKIYSVEADRRDPSPVPGVTYSGRFNLRISQELHERLSNLASAEKRSLNSQAVLLLEEGVTRAEREKGLAE